jgi:RNA polymerase sigma factor (sigma-70 family)
VSDRFQTTRWSLVLAAARGDHGSAEALEWLCTTYWYPLYGFVRRSGHDPEAARDLTQSFFLSLLDRNSLQSIDRSQGRFRAFLLASVKHFLSNERDRARALKRRTDDPALRLDLEEAERRFLTDSASGLSPEDLFEAKWARTILDRAVRRLREEHETTGRGDLFHRLRGHLTGEETSYDVLAVELGMSEGALRVAVHRLRRRLGILLRAEVAQTVADPDDVDGEVRYLLQAVGRVA